ncbi:MAG: TonB family protein [Bacteroidales bacterium]|nr:TonB family protein [Bacteroidales bacterium]
MKGKSICQYLKSVRRTVAEANNIDLEIPECTFEGECSGTCPSCEEEVRLLERSLKARRMMAQKVAIAGVAAGLSIIGGTAAAQNVTPTDSVTTLDGIEVIYTRPLLEPDGTVTYAPRHPVVMKRKVIKAPAPWLVEPDGSVVRKCEEAYFPGGWRACDRYIDWNMTYPEDWGPKGCAYGVVVVRFLVNADGHISRVRVVKRLHPLLDKEAKRLVANMPPWEPTKVKGKKVARYYEISINFLPR